MACACLPLQLRKSVSDFRSLLSTTLPSPLCHSFFSVIIDCSIFFHRWLSYQVVHRVPAKVCLVCVCHKFSNCLFHASFTTLFLNLPPSLRFGTTQSFPYHISCTCTTRHMTTTRIPVSPASQTFRAAANASCSCGHHRSTAHRRSSRPHIPPWCAET